MGVRKVIGVVSVALLAALAMQASGTIVLRTPINPASQAGQPGQGSGEPGGGPPPVMTVLALSPDPLPAVTGATGGDRVVTIFTVTTTPDPVTVSVVGSDPGAPRLALLPGGVSAASVTVANGQSVVLSVAADTAPAGTRTVSLSVGSLTRSWSVTTGTAQGRTCRTILAATPASPNGAYQIDPDGTGGRAPFTAWCDMTTDGGGWILLTNFAFGSNFTFSDTASFGADVNVPVTAAPPVSGTHDWRKLEAIWDHQAVLRYTNSANANNRYERYVSYTDYVLDHPGRCVAVTRADVIGGAGNGTQASASVTFGTTAIAQGNGFARDGIVRGTFCRGGFADSEGLGRNYGVYTPAIYAAGTNLAAGQRWQIWFREGAPIPVLRRQSCKEILDAGESTGSGLYTIRPSGSAAPLSVWCDMTDDGDGAGWTLVGRSWTPTLSNDGSYYYVSGASNTSYGGSLVVAPDFADTAYGRAMVVRLSDGDIARIPKVSGGRFTCQRSDTTVATWYGRNSASDFNIPADNQTGNWQVSLNRVTWETIPHVEPTNGDVFSTQGASFGRYIVDSGTGGHQCVTNGATHNVNSTVWVR